MRVYKESYRFTRPLTLAFLCGTKYDSANENDKRKILKKFLQSNISDCRALILEENFWFKKTTEKYLSYDEIFLRDLIISKVFKNGKSEKESYLSYLFDTYVRNCCFKCNKITGETNLKKAECGCEFHDECYKNIMIENFGHLGTEPHNLFLREKAEKDGKLEFICSKCKKVYYENIFEIIPQDKLKVFMQRIKKTFMSCCISCGEEIQTKNKHVLQFNVSQLKLDGYKCKIVDDAIK